ncbi:hypothetical protein LTR10_011817 [Elasticomyces elasticus]|uniref:Transcription factor domain-containing protein n=1 Tax=Exophiala sideris TaxID=1016849 RepID=A0ABR0JDK6_9EURO|nr:hypothetical protein LTR10_011817 [Elasticomyces elasticus]KAK5031726.1 hypothetical protein LTS07_004346 [Exophiala sideris]KAK5040655.1 hypothetical protein LTR13_002955 [Exophiala sideris]KAK5062011.1 hypothetical protein LTR69_005195 [Exophiala sideris]KAK5184711.1 hypothetical protein LTR44_003386 [Eurotiomycetes sp. CCFEE 6388]
MSSPAPDRATQMSYVLLKFRVYEICSEICQAVMSKASSSIEQIFHIDRSITQEQSNWDRKYKSRSPCSVNDVHQRLHLNVLYSTSYHLTLLLHQNVWTNQSQGEARRDWSRKRVSEGARKLLDLHADFAKASDLAPFRWYLRGIGSFHAFHAAVVLFTLSKRETSSALYADMFGCLRRCLGIFESLSDVSRICNKAAPVLRSLLSSLPMGCTPHGNRSIASTIEESQQHHYGLQQLSLEPFIPPKADNMYGTDINMTSFETMYGQFNSQQWLTPSAMPWDNWDQLLEGYNENMLDGM